MAHRLLTPNNGDDTGTPRWVKASGVIGALLAVLVVVLMFTGGRHGPWRHLPGAPPSSVEGGH